jgi:CMP-N-acetylneuraminic acid synthetase
LTKAALAASGKENAGVVRLVFFSHPAVCLRSQDLPPMFEENPLLCLFNRGSFARSGGNRIGRAPQMFATPPSESVDIGEGHNFILNETLREA